MNRAGISPIDKNPYLFEDIELKLNECGRSIEVDRSDGSCEEDNYANGSHGFEAAATRLRDLH